MICPILCEAHSSRAAHLLCRHIDRFLHPALCSVHKYGILQMCLQKQQRNHTITRILCLLSHLFLWEEMRKSIPFMVFQKQVCVKRQATTSRSIDTEKDTNKYDYSSLSLGESKHRTTLNPLRKSAYQNLQGEKRNQNHAVTNICKFDYSKYDFLDRSCLPHDTCEIKKSCWFTTIRTQGEKKKSILAVDCFSFSPLQISQNVSSFIIFFFYSCQICY